LGDKADPERVASDIERAATAGTVAASDSSNPVTFQEVSV
jgi:hypothetical protein